ncbi:MAG: L-fucose/L-arabinose isomerase family protein, partial [Patescibacteria group bacterium]
AVRSYVNVGKTPEAALLKMAKLGAVIDEWIAQNELSAAAVQCWTSLQEFYGVVPCMLMSMLSNSLIPSACEVDIPGLLGMYALQLASGRPSAIADWNNNYGDDPDLCVLFHCSNFPREMLLEGRMDYQYIIAGTVGKENTHGTMTGRIKPGPFTFARLSTDDREGMIRAYVGEGRFTDDPLETFGGYGVARIPDLQGLLNHICFNAFEHHVAISHGRVARAVAEAMDTYLGYDVYYHNEE